MIPNNNPYYQESWGTVPGGLIDSRPLQGFKEDAPLMLVLGILVAPVAVPSIAGAVIGYKKGGVLGTLLGAAVGAGVGFGGLKLYLARS